MSLTDSCLSIELKLPASITVDAELLTITMSMFFSEGQKNIAYINDSTLTKLMTLTRLASYTELSS